MLSRIFRITLIAVGVFSVPGVSPAQTSDPQAISVLTQALNAAGGPIALGSIRDFTATGTITYFWAGSPVPGTATARGRGADQFRLDASIPQGARSHAVSHGQGAFKDTSGTVKPIPYHNTVNVGILTFPFPGIIARLNDPLTSITYVGLVQLAARQTHQVRVRRQFGATTDPNGTLSNLTVTDYFVDAQTYLLVKVTDMTHPVGTLTRSYQHDIELENYTNIGGVNVPMLVREKITGQTIWELRLSSVSFNTGLTDADFAL